MTKPAVFLHIGEPKCGTTFVQEVLWRNQSLLSRRGVLLPGGSADAHYRAAQDLRGVEQLPTDPGRKWAGAWSSLVKEVQGAGDVAVVSHELIVGANEEQAARAVSDLQPAEVHAVVTARDFASLLPAEWQETVKHRNARTWHQWLGDIIDTPPARRRPRARWFWAAHDTAAALQRWAKLLTPERVHLVTVPPSGSPPDLLWRRFANVVRVADLPLVTHGARANASLGAVETELLRRVNERLPEMPQWFYARHVKGALAHGVLANRPRSERVAVPAERHAWIREFSASRVADIERLGVDVVGDLADLVPPEVLPDGVGPEELTDRTLLDAAVDLLAATIEGRYRRTIRPVVPQRGRGPGGRESVAASGLIRWRTAAGLLPRALRRPRVLP